MLPLLPLLVPLPLASNESDERPLLVGRWEGGNEGYALSPLGAGEGAEARDAAPHERRVALAAAVAAWGGVEPADNGVGEDDESGELPAVVNEREAEGEGEGAACCWCVG